MLLTQMIRKSFVATSLVIFLTLSMAFGSTESLASTMINSQNYLTPPYLIVVSKTDSDIKSIDERVEEEVGNVASDPLNKMEGKTKKTGEDTQPKVEDVKDSLKSNGKLKTASKKADKKVQKAKKKIEKSEKSLKKMSNKSNAVIQ
jgi:uncharacterized protein YjbJ (UPF0337 family)